MSTTSDSAVVHAQWRKASRSAQGSDACVEVADLQAAIGVRDSKDPDGPRLTFDPSEWAGFASRIRAGELDL